MTVRALSWWISLVLIGTVVVSAQKPPEKNPNVQKIANEVSAANIRTIVEKLVSFGTRHTLSDTTSNTRGIGAARRWIKSEFERYAKSSGGRMTVEFHESIFLPSARVPQPAKIVNVVATLEPSAQSVAGERMFLVTGHYDSRASNPLDSLSDAPGANDDGSGTALVLELARVMSKYQFRATLVFIAFAGEEQGLLGAYAWAEMARQKGLKVEGVFNNDIVGGIQSGDGSVESTYVRLFSEAYSPSDTGTVFHLKNSLGLENDGPDRSLARYIKEIGEQYVSNFGIKLIYRRDRFLRGGDHLPFHERGFAAVRFSVVKENYDWQHQDIRTENGRRYGDLQEFMDFDYCANVARVNGATLASLAFAPAPPASVAVVTTQLDYGSELRWSKNKEADLAGYLVRYRETHLPEWQGSFFTTDTSLTLKLSKDDYLFAVQGVDQEGNASLPALPRPIR